MTACLLFHSVQEPVEAKACDQWCQSVQEPVEAKACDQWWQHVCCFKVFKSLSKLKLVISGVNIKRALKLLFGSWNVVHC